MKNPELLHTASEQFLGKKEHEIKSTVLQTLEGHLRAILGTLTVEEVYKNVDQFALCIPCARGWLVEWELKSFPSQLKIFMTMLPTPSIREKLRHQL